MIKYLFVFTLGLYMGLKHTPTETPQKLAKKDPKPLDVIILGPKVDNCPPSPICGANETTYEEPIEAKCNARVADWDYNWDLEGISEGQINNTEIEPRDTVAWVNKGNYVYIYYKDLNNEINFLGQYYNVCETEGLDQ
jgi:hypothetical protein